MTWTKLSDDFSDDCWSLSDAAFRLHVEALVWSNRKLLDLKIPKADLRRFAKTPDAAAELVAHDWWTEVDGVFLIRHHATYQRPRESVLRQQEVNRTNRAKGKARPTKGTGAPREVVGLSVPDESSNASTDERDWTGLDGSGLENSTYREAENENIDLDTGEVLDLFSSTTPTQTIVDPWADPTQQTSCVQCGGWVGKDREAMGTAVCGPCARGETRRAS